MIKTGKPDTSLDHPDFVKCLAVVEPYVITGGRDEDIRIFEIAVKSPWWAGICNM